MKTMNVLTIMLTILLSLQSCKKDKTEPKEEAPVVIQCNYKTSGIYEGKYVTTANPNFTDTIVLSFEKDNCPDPTIRYRIKGMPKAFGDYGSPIVNRDYIVNVNEDNKFGSIADTMNIKFAAANTNLSISCLTSFNNQLSPYLVFKKVD